MNYIDTFIISVSIVLWLLLGWAGWVLTVDNTKNKEWLKKVNTDESFKKGSLFFHVIFGFFSFINGIIHSI